jgi:subtilisin family serine protease
MLKKLMVLTMIFTMLIAAVAPISSSFAISQPDVSSTDENISQSQLIVKFKSNATDTEIADVIQRNHGKLLGTDYRLGFSKVRVGTDRSLDAQLADYATHPAVEYAEPDYVVSPSYIPNDPSYNNQWHLPKMNVDQAWDISRGSSNVRIAVIDSGVDADHVDLASKLVGGYNTIDNNTNTNDDDGHGTHVAGIAAAATDNGLGVAGVCANCRIMPIKAMNASGIGYTSDIAEGIRWAADNGARVINLSLSSTSNSTAMASAVNYAFNKGCVIVAAAGNDGGNVTSYPAANDNVIAVAATDFNNNRASFSNFGSFVDLAAPGVSILSTTNDGGYGYKQGTSMATPNVAGVAALLLSFNSQLTPAQVEQTLKSTALDLGSAGRDDYYGNGLVNAFAAISTINDSTPPTVPTDLIATSRPSSVSLSWTSASDNVGVTSYEVFMGTTPLNMTSVGSTISTGFTAKGLTNGQSYSFHIRAKDKMGNQSLPSATITAKAEASTTPYVHTIVLDKQNDFNTLDNLAANETFSTSTANFFANVTWDANFLYLGYTGADLQPSTPDASSKWLAFYFGGTNGTSTGTTYNTQSPTLPFQAKYHVRWKVDGTYFNRMVYSNGTWTDAGNYPISSVERSGQGYVEFKIPLADLGNPTSLQMLSYLLNEKSNSEWTWAANPAQSIVMDGYDRDFRSFYEFDLRATTASAAQVYNYQLNLGENAQTTTNISFRQPVGASNVVIQYSQNGGLNWTQATTASTLNANSTVTQITGLTSNTPYKFRMIVTGGDSEGSSAIVNEDMFFDLTAPTAPQSLNLDNKGVDSIQFSWTASTDNVKVKDYVIFVDGVERGTTPFTTYYLTSLKAATSYSITVKARDENYNISDASIALVVTTSAINAVYSHTIVLDGNNDFYNSTNPDKAKNETFLTSSLGMTSFVSWDENYIYFAYQSADIQGNTSNASQKWIWLYVGGEGGTTTGINYAGQQPGLPFAAKYHIRFKVDGTYANRLMWNGSAWQDMGNYGWGTNIARNDSNQFVEFRIPRTHLGMDAAKTMQWVSALAYEDGSGAGDWMWAAVPEQAFSFGYDRDFTRYYEFDMTSMNGPAAQVYNYRFSAATVNPYEVRFQYTPPDGASSVYVEASEDGGNTWVKQTTYAVILNSEPYLRVTNLTPGKTYKFRMQVSGGPNTGTSSITQLTVPLDTVPPPEPKKPIARTIDASRVLLEFETAYLENDVKEFRLYQGDTLLATTTGPFYEMTGLKEYTEYTYKLQAIDLAGNVSSFSPSLTIRTKDITAPTTPSQVDVISLTKSGFTLRWFGATDSGSGIQNYEIYRNGLLIASLPATDSQYTFTGLEEYSSHTLRILAIDQANNRSEMSNGLVVRTLDVTAPTAPTNLVTSNVTANGFVLSWNAAQDNVAVAGYRIYFNGTLEQTVSAAVLQAEFTGLVSGMSYTIQLSAYDQTGNESTLSQSVSVQLLDNVTPTAPSNLAATNITTTGFRVSWAVSTDNVAVTGYNVYRNGAYVASVTSPAYTFTGLVAGTTYNITVLAYDASRNRSTLSSALSVMTTPLVTVDTQAPTRPANLVSSNLTSNGFKVTWTASTDNVKVTGYNVYRNGTYVASVTSPAYTFSGLAANTTYQITVLAYDAAKNRSALSTALSVKTLLAGADVSPPTVPTNLIASSITTTGFRLSWTASTDNVRVAGYNVYRNGVYVASVTGTSYTISGLIANTSYNITVLSYDDARNRSALSAPLAVKTSSP